MGSNDVAKSSPTSGSLQTAVMNLCMLESDGKQTLSISVILEPLQKNLRKDNPDTFQQVSIHESCGIPLEGMSAALETQ